jgi:hypothetical protein
MTEKKKDFQKNLGAMPIEIAALSRQSYRLKNDGNQITS